MKDKYRHVGITRFCRLLGITRQAWYQHFWHTESITIEQELVLQQVLQIRKSHRHMGGRKLYEKLQPFMIEHQIKMGRDALFDLLAANHLLVRKKKRAVYTTNSFHWLRKYPNLIRDFVPNGPNQLWVSDITYWKIKLNFVYISFITDAYSHKVVGYHVAESLEAIETQQALKMALEGLKQQPDKLIHHSDRGIQYCSGGYVKLLQDNRIKISMTENGDPLENAIAERLNGIIKQEYLYDHQPKDINQAKVILTSSVDLYNDERPHESIGNLTPENVHSNHLITQRLWKNYYSNKRKLVNVLQDEKSTVNLSQD
ncbi:MAG: IS3 family transposase [Flavobacteriales bacterium]|nr:IS3 family transposase [Flavobacteriales bacterium]